MATPKESPGSWRYVMLFDDGDVDQWTCNDHEVAKSRVTARFERALSMPFAKEHVISAVLLELTEKGWELRSYATPKPDVERHK